MNYHKHKHKIVKPQNITKYVSLNRISKVEVIIDLQNLFFRNFLIKKLNENV